MRKSISKLSIKSAGLLLGMTLLVGCGNEKQIIEEPTAVTIETITEESKEVLPDRYAADYRKNILNPLFSDEEWDYVNLYIRDVRHYTDGSIGYSEWRYDGEYYLRDADLIESFLEYKVERISKVNIHDVIADLMEDPDIQVYYAGNSMIKLSDIKVFRVYARDFINGEYTDYKCNGCVYISDNEVIDNDLIDIDDITDELTLTGVKTKKYIVE